MRPSERMARIEDAHDGRTVPRWKASLIFWLIFWAVLAARLWVPDGFWWTLAIEAVPAFIVAVLLAPHTRRSL